MSVLNNSLLLGADAGAGGYSISRSLRFNAPDSAYLSRTPASAGNRKTWTWAGWVKRSKLSGAIQKIFTAGTSGSSHTGIQVTASEQLEVFHFAGSYVFQLVTTQVLRDLSAWMHIAVAVDSTQATASNRVKLYVNGSQVTTFSTSSYPATQNADFEVNNTSFHAIAKSAVTAESNYVDGYLADIHFIDGQALDPTSFGEFSATTGVWMPKAFSGGSYGTNGFRLDFSDNSAATATTLGKDRAGSNNWTPNNLSVTAGAGNDSLVDVPTNGSEVDTGLGGQVRGNYCTINPIASNTNNSYTNGNLDTSCAVNVEGVMLGTIGVSSGKWYFEGTIVTQNGASEYIGVANQALITTNNAALGSTVNGWAITCQNTANNGKSHHNNVSGTDYGTISQGDVVGVAFDVDAAKVWFSVNGTWFNSGAPASGTGAIFTNLSGTTIFPAASNYNGGAMSFNFGARPFAYTAPSGFKALNTANLSAPTIVKPSTVMDVVTYTGTGSTLTPTSSLGFNPDLVWIKSRSAATDNTLYDVVRGAQARLESNNADAEVTSDNGLTAFNSAGFTLGTLAQVNTSSATYAAWTWDAGSSTVTNTQGSISSQVRANPSAGFSVVTYNTATSNPTVGHGLGVTPEFIITKSRTDGSGGWAIYHKSIGLGSWLEFTTAAVQSALQYWGTTAFNSTTFSVGTSGYYNNRANMIAYCFAPVAGYSSFGRYTGNGSTDGPFVYTGFRPRWIMLKRTDSTSNWAILDATRLGYNVRNDSLYASLADAEANFGLIDILSNGFKLRATFTSENGGTHIYCAFAEHPFQYARAR
jgi:hypothetical protein